MNKIKELCIKYKDILLYGFFGVCTTIVNFIVYFILSKLSLFPKSINTVTNTWIAWFAAVLFAYLTNRKWVFESKASGKGEIISEISAFFACRIGTGCLEAAAMYVCVDKLLYNEFLVKIIVTFVVIIINYVASKMFIFKKEKEQSI